MAPKGQDVVDQHQVQQVVIGKGDLVTHDESFASLVLGQQDLKGLRCPGRAFT